MIIFFFNFATLEGALLAIHTIWPGETFIRRLGKFVAIKMKHDLHGIFVYTFIHTPHSSLVT